MKYYNELGIQSTATHDQIKKSYRKLAILLHPDKNINDPEASQKFQKLGEAYQVLSNPQLRHIYDSQGVQTNKNSLVDSSQLYQIVFGSERFESFVGELSLLSMKDQLQDPENMSKLHSINNSMNLRQKRREVKCAVNLAKLLEGYLTDKSEDFINFKTVIRSEAKGFSKLYRRIIRNIIRRHVNRSFSI
jgi:curved DNA-binding protein CbpA